MKLSGKREQRKAKDGGLWMRAGRGYMQVAPEDTEAETEPDGNSPNRLGSIHSSHMGKKLNLFLTVLPSPVLPMLPSLHTNRGSVPF